MKETLENFRNLAVSCAYDAGKLTLGYFQRGIEADFKADDSPVTIADKQAEALIRQHIEAAFPQHAIIGEEFGESNADASHRWFVDPIDGTKSFVRGVPLYAVLIGLEIEGRVEAGAVYFPALGDMLYAASGQGCFWNGKQVQVIDTKDMARAVVSFTDAANFQVYGRDAAWQRVMQSSYYRVGWSDAYGHALVASGRLELMLDPVMNPWDCGPFPVLLREAGGFFGSWKGEESLFANEAISTTKTLLPQVLELLAD
jgi:myo-inositol-1(or 4)-monophosphatase